MKKDLCLSSDTCQLLVDRVLHSSFRNQKSIYETVEKCPAMFSLFKKAVDFTGLVSLLSDDDESLTVVVPTNFAFERLPIQTLENLFNNKTALKTLLANHIFKGTLDRTVLDALDGQIIQSVRGSTYEVKISNDEVYLCFFASGKEKKIRILKATPARNGIILTTDELLG